MPTPYVGEHGITYTPVPGSLYLRTCPHGTVVAYADECDDCMEVAHSAS